MRIVSYGSKHFAEVIAENTEEREYLAGVVMQQQNKRCEWCKEYLTTTANAENIVKGFNHGNKSTESSH